MTHSRNDPRRVPTRQTSRICRLDNRANEKDQCAAHDAVLTAEAGGKWVEGHTGDKGTELLETDGEGVDFGLFGGCVVKVGHERLKGEDTSGDT